MTEKHRIVLTGAAGLVGQNLITRLKHDPAFDFVCIDKHPANCRVFRQLHPDVTLIEADLATSGPWQESFAGAHSVVINHAQIGGLTETPFTANNVTATKNVLEAAKSHSVDHLVHISSSVVNSQADDFYTRSKTAQEEMVRAAGLPVVILRPTLMFGWFDRKHLGWLARFMKRAPVFPIPGRGAYLRQPLYAGDFCSVIGACLKDRSISGVYDISGLEKISYVELIRLLKRASGGTSRIVHIPYSVFWALLWVYALFSKSPPFTTSQLEALVIPEEFPVIDWPGIFQVEATSLEDAMQETFAHPENAHVTLEF